jgi:transcriptional regulator with XRE-family HTH domain
MSAGYVRTLGLAAKFVLCEQSAMSKPTFSELVEATGISRGYASDILNGKQAPSRPLAVHIYRKTGWRHPLLAGLSDEQLDVLESIEPWSPSQAAA